MSPAYDFIQEIMSHGDDIEVLTPIWLRNLIKRNQTLWQRSTSSLKFSANRFIYERFSYVLYNFADEKKQEDIETSVRPLPSVC